MPTPAAPPAWQNPSTPQLHDAAAHPATLRPLDAELPNIISLAPRETRGWRIRSYGASPLSPGVGTESTPDQLARVHTADAPANPRKLFGSPVQAGNPGHPSKANAITPEHLDLQVHGPNVITTQAPPSQTRAGGVGADNTRNAHQNRWLFTRLFDQGIEQRMGVTHKAPTARVLASLPPMFAEDIAGGLPSPGGRWRARGMEGVGIQPNSVRLMPRAWDAELVNDGADKPDNSAASQTARRARNWKA